ncbi:hypothetical protein [Enterococcus durans]|uniref:hypothetical protein n=1 Tax=Enterococcus durans TaxID=53345 RepID=UPI001C9B8B4B|nr:hypothetical protein [Enterococcus durans]
MNLITQYSDIILKKIMAKIQKDKKSKGRAELVKLEMAETGSGVRTARHWKAVELSLWTFMTNGSVLQENILSLINERPVKHCIVFYTGLWT